MHKNTLQRFHRGGGVASAPLAYACGRSCHWKIGNLMLYSNPINTSLLQNLLPRARSAVGRGPALAGTVDVTSRNTQALKCFRLVWWNWLKSGWICKRHSRHSVFGNRLNSKKFMCVKVNVMFLYCSCLFVGRGPVTELLAGSTFEVSWSMGYAHPVSIRSAITASIRHCEFVSIIVVSQ